jgi:hypothetical protein
MTPESQIYGIFIGAATKGGPKTPVKPSAQKGAAKTAPPKQAAAAAAAVKTPQGKKKKGHKHQQYELIVTINLVRLHFFSPFTPPKHLLCSVSITALQKQKNRRCGYVSTIFLYLMTVNLRISNKYGSVTAFQQ